MKYLFAANATRKRNGIYTWWMVMILLICGNARLVNGKKLHWQQGSSLQDTCNPRLSTRSKSPILLSTLTLSCRGGQQYYSDDRNNDYYHNEDDYGNYQQDYDDRYNYKRDDDRYGDSKKKRSAVTSLLGSWSVSCARRWGDRLSGGKHTGLELRPARRAWLVKDGRGAS